MLARDLGKRRAKLYDSLARWEWLRRVVRREEPGAGLELHKALSGAAQLDDGAPRGPTAGKAGLHDWLHDRLDVAGAHRVLELGCGFGATVLAWARAEATSPRTKFVGLGLSGYQIAKARATATRLGVDDRCEFRQQSFDDAIEGPFDRVVSIEVLVHAEDLAKTLSGIAESMSPGARLMVVEDVLDDDADVHGASRVHEDSDVLLWKENWFSKRVYSLEDWRSAADVAGLDWASEVDLSAQVPHRDAPALARSERRLARAKRFFPTQRGRDIAAAFLGGVALERLYARNLLRYLVIDLRKREHSS